MKNFNQKYIFVIYLTFLSLTSFAQSQDATDEKGLRHGSWKGYYNDSKILRYVGNFNHGKEQGLFTYYANSDKNIVMATRNFDNKNNAFTIFYDESKNWISVLSLDVDECGRIYAKRLTISILFRYGSWDRQYRKWRLYQCSCT